MTDQAAQERIAPRSARSSRSDFDDGPQHRPAVEKSMKKPSDTQSARRGEKKLGKTKMAKAIQENFDRFREADNNEFREVNAALMRFRKKYNLK